MKDNGPDIVLERNNLCFLFFLLFGVLKQIVAKALQREVPAAWESQTTSFPKAWTSASWGFRGLGVDMFRV